MATQVGNVIFQISADLKNIQGQLRTLEGSFQSSFGKISGMASSLAGTLGIGLSVGALVSYGKQIVQTVSQLQDLAQQTGFAASTLSGFKNTLEENGTTVESFAHAMFNLQRRIGDIDKTTDPLLDTIKRLGLNFEELRRSSPEEVGRKITEALAKIPDQTTRVTSAFALFGREGRQFLPAMEELAKGWDNLRKSGLTDQEIKRVDEFGDTMTRLGNRLYSFATDRILKTVEAIQKLKQELNVFGLSQAGIGGQGAVLGGAAGAVAGAKLPEPPKPPPRLPPLRDPAAEQLANKAKALTEALKDQMTQLEAQAMAWDQTAEAAKRFELEQRVIKDLGAAALPQYRDQIEAIVKLNAANQERLIIFEGLKEAGRNELDRQREIVKGIEEEIKARESIKFQGLKEAGENELERQRDIVKEIEAQIKKRADDEKKVLEQSQREWESLFDSITNGIGTTLQGVRLGTQTMGEAIKRLAQNIGISFLEEFTKLAVFNPLKNVLFGLTGTNAAPTINTGSVIGSILKFLPWFQSGGIVPGSAGQPVPIVAHAGERVIPRGGNNAQAMRAVVNINGDILPRQDWVTRDQVIQIGYQQFNERSGWMAVVENRISPR